MPPRYWVTSTMKATYNKAKQPASSDATSIISSTRQALTTKPTTTPLPIPLASIRCSNTLLPCRAVASRLWLWHGTVGPKSKVGSAGFICTPRRPCSRGKHPLELQGSPCVNCHMPSKTYMGVHLRRDHSLRIPRLDQSATLGVPNARNQCHNNKTPSWLIWPTCTASCSVIRKQRPLLRSAVALAPPDDLYANVAAQARQTYYLSKDSTAVCH